MMRHGSRNLRLIFGRALAKIGFPFLTDSSPMIAAPLVSVTNASATRSTTTVLLVRFVQSVVLLALSIVVTPSSSDAQTSTSQCQFDGPPALAYASRPSDWIPGEDRWNIVIADSGANCELVAHMAVNQAPDWDGDDPDDQLAFRYLPNELGGGTGILIWGTGDQCSGSNGLTHAVFEVDPDGRVLTTLPFPETKLHCVDDLVSKGSTWRPAISPAGDRVAFFVTAPSGDFLAVAGGIGGGTLEAGPDLANLVHVAETVVPVYGGRVTWGPTGNALYYSGILEEDRDDYWYIYALDETKQGWTSSKLIRFDYYGVDGVRQSAVATSATLWDFDGNVPREVLAYQVYKYIANRWRPTRIEIISVPASRESSPVVIAEITGGLQFPSFTRLVTAGTAPHIYALNSTAPDRHILEIDPRTGNCVPVDDCVVFGSLDTNEVRPKAAIESVPVEVPLTSELEALPVILELLLDKEDATPNGE